MAFRNQNNWEISIELKCGSIVIAVNTNPMIIEPKYSPQWVFNFLT